MSGQPPASGDAKTSPLQDKKVQIGLGVGALVVVIGAVVGVLMMNRGGGGDGITPAAPVATSEQMAPGAPSGGATAPGAPTGMGGPPMGGPGMGSPMGGTTMGGTGAPAAGASAAGETRPPAGPRVASRGNAFAPNAELKNVIGSIPPKPGQPTVMATAHDLFLELNPPKPDVEVAGEGADQGPPIPPMRVSGIVLGNVVSAVLQLGDGNNSQFINVVPGKMIPEGNPVYRVASIENGSVTLVRRWEEGNRKGVQRIEVTLSGSANRGGGNFGGGGGGGVPASGEFN